MTSLYSIAIEYPPNGIIFTGYFSVVNGLVTSFYDSTNPGVDIYINNGFDSENSVFITVPTYSFSNGGTNITSLPYFTEHGDDAVFFNLYGDDSIDGLTVDDDNTNSYTVVFNFAPITDPFCFLWDCDILLENNLYKNITELSVDDKVLGFFSNQPQTINKIYKQTCKLHLLENNNKPFLIRKNLFGENIPNKDIHLSGHHRIVQKGRDDMFLGIQTFKLDKTEEDLKDEAEIDYYHIVLENKTEGIIVNGLPVESCLE